VAADNAPLMAIRGKATVAVPMARAGKRVRGVAT